MKKQIITNGIEPRILLLRGRRVMMDTDLARLYGVETKALNLAVRRNRDRFPGDFMFRLTREEAGTLRLQIETSSWGGRRYLPCAFTEQGVSMLSSVLRSRRAVRVNIEIMRTFVRLRRMTSLRRNLGRKIGELEKKYDHQFKVVFDAIRSLMAEPEEPPRERIGFRQS